MGRFTPYPFRDHRTVAELDVAGGGAAVSGASISREERDAAGCICRFRHRPLGTPSVVRVPVIGCPMHDIVPVPDPDEEQIDPDSIHEVEQFSREWVAPPFSAPGAGEAATCPPPQQTLAELRGTLGCFAPGPVWTVDGVSHPGLVVLSGPGLALALDRPSFRALAALLAPFDQEIERA